MTELHILFLSLHRRCQSSYAVIDQSCRLLDLLIQLLVLADSSSMQTNCGQDWVLGVSEIVGTRIRVHNGTSIIHTYCSSVMVSLCL
jgi:hypothetical protein